MDYKETIEYLYRQLPMFSRVGAAAYKPGLDTSVNLARFFGDPHRKFRSIHIAGTNGKGSVSNMIAAMLQAQGYKTALYTSPHLVDFRERIRINGEMIPRGRVVDFVERFRSSGYEGHPSFFELTMMLAFDWFAAEKVDYAVIEVGMGGRLDSTNIITPELSVITNISFDHTQFLGDTLEKIATEKAGIIKSGIPVVVGEAKGVVRKVFEEKAEAENAPVCFAEDADDVVTSICRNGWKWRCNSVFGRFESPLAGEYQRKNIATALCAALCLRRAGITLWDAAVVRGMEDVERLTHFRGRWSVVSESPLTICDTGHNEAGLNYNMRLLSGIIAYRKDHGKDVRLHLVLGFVSDKDVEHIIDLFPSDAVYYATQAAIPRALPYGELTDMLVSRGLDVTPYPDVAQAVAAALSSAAPSDVVYIGGSTFIVADYFATYHPEE